MWKRNLLVMLGFISAIQMTALLSEWYRRNWPDVPWEWSTAVVLVVFFLVGAVAFFSFAGGFWTRTALATSIPLVGLPLSELIFGSSPGYEWLGVMVGVVLAIPSFLGCVFVGGPGFLWIQQREARHLTNRSSRDRPQPAGR
jgi:hypothetical protein